MSNFAGVTFANQHIAPEDDAAVRRAIFADGILTGCYLAFSGSALTMESGYLMLCGRQIRHADTQSWDTSGHTSGFARLLLTIDLTHTATEEEFNQVADTLEYADTLDNFADLVQEDINASGTKYQVQVCVLSLTSGGINGIIDPLTRIDSQ